MYARSAHGVEVIESHGRGTIRAQCAIHAADDDIARTRIAARFGGKNFIGDGFTWHVYQSVARRTNVRTGSPVGPFAM